MTLLELEKQVTPEGKEALRYIEKLASVTNTDISLWAIDQVFGLDSGGLALNKNVLNRRFFEHLETVKALEPKRESPPIPQALLDELNTLIPARKDALLERLKSERHSSLSLAATHQRRVEESIRKAHELWLELSILSSEPERKLSDQMKLIAESSFWEFEPVNSTYTSLSFITRSPVILTHKNPAAGLDLQVNLGKFAAFIRPGQAKVLVRMYSDNVTVGEYYHPHISRDGSVCWGSASETASRRLACGDYVSVMNLLAANLTYYNPEAPYVALERFVKSHPASQIEGEPDMITCLICEGDVDSCSCCGRCEQVADDCVCCSICDGNGDECDCCRDCNRTGDECECGREE